MKYLILKMDLDPYEPICYGVSILEEFATKKAAEVFIEQQLEKYLKDVKKKVDYDNQFMDALKADWPYPSSFDSKTWVAFLAKYKVKYFWGPKEFMKFENLRKMLPRLHGVNYHPPKVGPRPELHILEWLSKDKLND